MYRCWDHIKGHIKIPTQTCPPNFKSVRRPWRCFPLSPNPQNHHQTLTLLQTKMADFHFDGYPESLRLFHTSSYGEHAHTYSCQSEKLLLGAIFFSNFLRTLKMTIKFWFRFKPNWPTSRPAVLGRRLCSGPRIIQCKCWTWSRSLLSAQIIANHFNVDGDQVQVNEMEMYVL